MRAGTKIKALGLVLALILLFSTAYAAKFNINKQKKFNKGVYYNTYYNTTNNALQLNSTTGKYISKIFNAQDPAEWYRIKWIASKTGKISAEETDGLILLMHLDETSGTITDDSGQNNNGTYNGNLYSQTGEINKSIGFDGHNDEIKIERTNNPELDPTKEVTLSAWVKNTNRNHNYMRYIICRAGGSQGCSYGLYFNDGNTYDRLGTEIVTNNGRQRKEWDWTGINTKWFHWAMTFTNGTMKLYVNGQEKANWTGLGNTLVHRTQYANDDLYIGATDTAKNAYAHIDEVAIWNRTLNAQEIEEIYTRAITDFNISIRGCSDITCNNSQWNRTETQNILINNTQYFQFKTELSTENTNYSPQIFRVKIKYTVLPDTLTPAIYPIKPAENSTYAAGQTTEIAANITDNKAIDTAKAIIKYPESTTEIMLANTSDKYNSSFTAPNILGRYNLTFFANDTSDNINNTETTYFNIIDTTPPAVWNVTPRAGTNFSLNSVVQITANITDNIAVDRVFANVTNPDLSVTWLELYDNDFDNIYNNSVVADQAGWYYITIIANDTSGNINNTVKTNFDPASLGGWSGGGGGVASKSYQSQPDWRKMPDAQISIPQCAESWLCTEWSKCKNRTQTRECSDWNKCGTNKTKPIITRNCTNTSDQKKPETKQKPEQPRFAIQPILSLKQTKTTIGVIGILAVILVLFLSIFLTFRKTKKRKKREQELLKNIKNKKDALLIQLKKVYKL